MPLSDRDKQRIAYSITDYISKIKVSKIQDFQLIIEGLLFITQPNQGHKISESQAEDFQDLIDYMDPSFMIVLPENQAEFIQFANELINNRINYFKKLSDQEKLKYIQDQAKHNRELKKTHDEKTQEKSNLFRHVWLKLMPNRLSVKMEELVFGAEIFIFFACLRFVTLSIIKGKELDKESGYFSNLITGANNITISEYLFSPISNYFYPVVGVLIAILSVANFGIFIWQSWVNRLFQDPEFQSLLFEPQIRSYSTLPFEPQIRRYPNRIEDRDYAFSEMQDHYFQH